MWNSSVVNFIHFLLYLVLCGFITLSLFPHQDCVSSRRRTKPAQARPNASLGDARPNLSHLCKALLNQRCSFQTCHIWPPSCHKNCLPFSQKGNRSQKELLQFTSPEADCECGEHVPGGTNPNNGSSFNLIWKINKNKNCSVSHCCRSNNTDHKISGYVQAMLFVVRGVYL